MNCPNCNNIQMKTGELISTDVFCDHYNVEISFIRELQRSGLIDITTFNDASFIHIDQLQQLEKIVRLYYDLDINLEGIETITYLLRRIDEMQNEIINLTNKLRLYEDISRHTTL